MASRRVTVDVRVKDSKGITTSKSVVINEATFVAGGYYLTGNADIRPDTTELGTNLKGFTQYHSFAEPYILPGFGKDYLKTLHANGVWGNYVIELKHYGTPNLGEQRLSFEGKNYIVPAPNMIIQKRPGTVHPKAYGYEQVWTGKIDGLLHKTLIQMRGMAPARYNIQLCSELDTDHEFGITENNVTYNWAQADERAVRAMNYILDYFRSRSLPTGVTFTVGMGGFDRASWTRIHHEYLMGKVDFLQWNAYRRSASQTAFDVFNRTKLWSDTDLGPVGRSKDIIIAEWGTPMSLNTPLRNDQIEYIKTVPAAIGRLNLESKTGQIVMANYFNSNDAWATLSPKAAGLQALKSAYRTPPFSA